jgi:hypothetical protein
MSGSGPGARHLWADDVEEDEAEEQQQRGAATSAPATARGAAAAPPAPSAATAGGSWADRAAGVAAERSWQAPFASGADSADWHAARQDECDGEDEEDDRRGGEANFEPRDGWHEALPVERGASRQRLNMQHGFVRDIVSTDCCCCSCQP